MSIAQAAIEQRQQSEAEISERLADKQREREAEYWQTLIRNDPSEAGHLTDLADQLGKSSDDIATDEEAVESALRIQPLAINKTAAKREYQDRLEDLASAETLSRLTVKHASCAKIDAANYESSCKHAVKDLEELRSDHPSLFGPDGLVIGTDPEALKSGAAHDREIASLQANRERCCEAIDTANGHLSKDLSRYESAGWKRWKTKMTAQLGRIEKRLNDLTGDSNADSHEEE